VVFRSVRNPIYLGLGTAAITALSAAVPVTIALAEDPSAEPSTAASSDPSASPSSDPSSDPQAPAAVPKLVVLVDAPASAHGGDAVRVVVQVFALEADAPNTKLRVTTSSGTVVPETATLGTVNRMDAADDVRTKSATVTIPKKMTSGAVTVTATASAPGATGDPTKKQIKVTKQSSSGSGSTGGSGSSGGSGGSGSSGGSTGGVGGVGAGGVSGAGSVPPLSDPGFVPASPAGALQNPQVALPQIAPQAGTPPTVAAAAPNSLRGGAPGAQELTFERLASTQAAWLAALLVAFSLLLTQLRLVRPYHVRLTGDHRRPRHGVFQR
jgi:hypothetical protein